METTTRVPIEVQTQQPPPEKKDDELRPLEMPPGAFDSKEAAQQAPSASVDLRPLNMGGETAESDTAAVAPTAETPTPATAQPEATQPLGYETKLAEHGEFIPGTKADEMAKAVTTAEAEEKIQSPETLRLTDQIMKELRRREEERLEQRYGKGFVGKGRKWLNSTQVGRAVKIGGKIVIGTSAAVGAGILTGGAGLVLAPAMFALGSKEAVDGAIEAGQYLVKGRKERLKLEDAKQEYFEKAEKYLSEVETQYEQGKISKEQFDQAVALIIEGIKTSEAEVTQKENANIISEKHQGRIRGLISGAVGLAGGLTFGLPLGHQVLGGAGHAVRASMHGINFIYGAGQAHAATVVHHLGGAVGHALTYTNAAGRVIGQGLPLIGKVAIGAAYAGLAARVGLQLRGARQVGNKELVLPQVSSEAEASQIQEEPAPEPAAQEGVAPAAEEGPMTEMPQPPEVTPQPLTTAEPVAGGPAIAPVGEIPPEAPTIQPAAAVPTETQPIAAQSPEMTGAQLKQVLGEAEKRFNYLPMRIGQIDKKLRELDAEYESIEGKAYKLPEDQARLKEIEAEHAQLQAEKEKLMAEKRELKDIDDYITTRDSIDQGLAQLEEDWGELDAAPIKNEDTRKQQEELQRRYWAERDRREAARQAVIASILGKNKPAATPATPAPEANVGAGTAV